MFSPSEIVRTDDTPLTLSLEFVWKAKSTYWAGEIHVVDLYVDDALRYTIKIPQSDDGPTETISLPFKKYGIGLPGSEINYLIIKNLDTTRKITLKAGIFKKKEGNTLMRNPDGSWSRSTSYTREDISLDLDMSALQLGKHYKIIAMHDMKRRSPGSVFWHGTDLHTIVEEDGPSKKNTQQPRHIGAIPFFSASAAAASVSRETLTSQLKFERRKEDAKTAEERAFFTLVLEKKYEEAIMYASNMGDQALGGRLILDLLECRKELAINVNAMTDNSLEQTPLHRVAINKKWYAYYALVERGADSTLRDKRGIPAQEYRRRGGMTVFNTEEQQKIRQGLFGDKAPAAEAFINAAANTGRIS